MCKMSVIVPAYNAQSYLKKCMDSLVNQTFKEYEVIVVNDGSSDNTKAILESYANKYETVKLIHQENQGQATARNVGVENARGEFICFVDSDDYISLEYLEKLATRQKEENADIVWCDAFVVKGNQKTLLSASEFITSDKKKNYILNNSGPWRKLIRASIIKEHNLAFPSLRSYEDIAVVPLYVLYAENISYINEALYYYILHEGSLMHQSTYNDKLHSIYASMDLVYQGFKKENRIHAFHNEIEYLYIEHLLHAGSLRFFKFDEGKNEVKKISMIMKETFPNWIKNKYYLKQNWKYKWICKLLYNNNFIVLKWLLK